MDHYKVMSICNVYKKVVLEVSSALRELKWRQTSAEIHSTILTLLSSYVPCYGALKGLQGDENAIFTEANNMVRDTLEQIDVTKQLAAQYSHVGVLSISIVSVSNLSSHHTERCPRYHAISG